VPLLLHSASPAEALLRSELAGDEHPLLDSSHHNAIGQGHKATGTTSFTSPRRRSASWSRSPPMLESCRPHEDSSRRCWRTSRSRFAHLGRRHQELGVDKLHPALRPIFVVQSPPECAKATGTFSTSSHSSAIAHRCPLVAGTTPDNIPEPAVIVCRPGQVWSPSSSVTAARAAFGELLHGAGHPEPDRSLMFRAPVRRRPLQHPSVSSSSAHG
jgi:hypothetical protein